MAKIGSKDKQEIIDAFKIHDTDRGSSEIQIALLTERINHLVEHLKLHKKDHHTRRSLLIHVGRRKKLLRYLQHENNASFKKIVSKLKIKVKDNQ